MPKDEPETASAGLHASGSAEPVLDIAAPGEKVDGGFGSSTTACPAASLVSASPSAGSGAGRLAEWNIDGASLRVQAYWFLVI